ncbi:hypothetical protein ONE63_003523 [Megalurothrips usitatus]|uniref:Uncharacterized protein n=1 Tax=Megalurothrips usitatus TaxID=439358 RepID=A0AAV7X7J9_9NEOP|nr:hypothetical protein ONE63_003523 [Megalurothrips usitatus]
MTMQDPHESRDQAQSKGLPDWPPPSLRLHFRMLRVNNTDCTQKPEVLNLLLIWLWKIQLQAASRCLDRHGGSELRLHRHGLHLTSGRMRLWVDSNDKGVDQRRHVSRLYSRRAAVVGGRHLESSFWRSSAAVA